MGNFGNLPNMVNSISGRKKVPQGNENSAINSSRRVSQPEAAGGISEKDFLHIQNSLRSGGYTDIRILEDIVSFKDSANFKMGRLSDWEFSKLKEIIQQNIADKVNVGRQSAESRDKYIEASNKEKAFVNNVLAKLRSGQVSNISQALDIAQASTSGNAKGIISQISGQISDIVRSNQPSQSDSLSLSSNALSGTDKISSAGNKTSGMTGVASAKKAIATINPATSIQNKAKNIILGYFGKNQITGSIDDGALKAAEMASAELLSRYLKRDNSFFIPSAFLTGKLETKISQVGYHDDVLANDANYLNEVATRIAAAKASTIYTCRIVGEIVGATSGMLGMAAVSTATAMAPGIGLGMGIIAALAGMMVGKAAGEQTGKIFVNLETRGDAYEQDTEVSKILAERELLRRIYDSDEDEEEEETSEKSETNEKEETAENTDENKVNTSEKSNSILNITHQSIGEVFKGEFLYHQGKSKPKQE